MSFREDMREPATKDFWYGLMFGVVIGTVLGLGISWWLFALPNLGGHFHG